MNTILDRCGSINAFHKRMIDEVLISSYEICNVLNPKLFSSSDNEVLAERSTNEGCDEFTKY